MKWVCFGCACATAWLHPDPQAITVFIAAALIILAIPEKTKK